MGIPESGTPSASISPSSSHEELFQRFGRLNILDDLIRLRAADADQCPILAYPKPSTGNTVEYEYFTGQELDFLVDQYVCALVNCGIGSPHKDGAIIALLSLSDLDMIVTFFALSRLEYTVMMLSPRLSASACVSLLEHASCDTVLYGQTSSIRSTLDEIIRLKPIACQPIVERSLHHTRSQDSSVLRIHRSQESAPKRSKIALILHSSGSTGNPKLRFLSHEMLITHPLRGPGFTSFNSLPWYHLHGLSTALQAMYMRRTAYLWDAALPLTASSVIAALEAAKPESVDGVPYLLQLLVDSQRGLNALRLSQLVTYGGAPCPDELGDRLVAEGVRFGGSFGLTEAGLVAESISRPRGDPYWNYMKFFDDLLPYIWMKPIGGTLYECVYLSGQSALTTSNSDDPPGSFHSRDVFTPHPTIPNRWKYASRLDDRITLVTGEKVLPLPIEGMINQSPWIQEAIVVGVGKPVPGLLVFRADEAQHFSNDEYLDLILPAIKEANARAEQFSQIAQDMVCVLPVGSVCPRTDKGSIIRAQVYAQYASVIEGLYSNSKDGLHGYLELDLAATEAHLLKLCRKEIDFAISSIDAEFFAEGMDSLKAIHFRRLILRDFKLEDPDSIGRNIVFEAGCIAQLARRILAVQSGRDQIEEDEMEQMEKLIEQYSSFRARNPSPGIVPNTMSVVLTGATGSIGAHVLYRLLNDDSVSAVYCLTRHSKSKEAIMQALAQKDLSVSCCQTRKIIAFNASLDEPNLGLSDAILLQIQQSVSLIIHVAWPVNFRLPLATFEPHIKGLHNLIQLSLSVHLPQPAVLLFCSSISTALNAPTTEIEEKPVNDLSHTMAMGYARSKLVGERIVSNAYAAGARAYSLRIGQVSGNSKTGLWNDSEALPLLVRSALTLKALPHLETHCSWIPVDNLACSIVEIARACADRAPDMVEGDDGLVYNLCNSRVFHWSALLETLLKNGFEFDTIPPNDWLDKLQESYARNEEDVNPAVKLMDHYKAMHGNFEPPKSFVTAKAERDSLTLRTGRLRIIEDGILDRYAQNWLSRWKRYAQNQLGQWKI